MPQNVIPSPCVDVCVLNADDLCIGCYRTGDEISLWWAMGDAEKKDVYERIKVRERQAVASPDRSE